MQGRYSVEFVPMERSEHTNQHCDHGCGWIIQFRLRSTSEIAYEVCLIEAEEIAKKLLVAVDEGSKLLPV